MAELAIAAAGSAIGKHLFASSLAGYVGYFAGALPKHTAFFSAKLESAPESSPLREGRHDDPEHSS